MLTTLLCGALALGSDAAWSSDTAATATPDAMTLRILNAEESRQAIEKVFAGKDFSETHTQTRYRLREEPDSQDNSESTWLIRQLEKLAEWLAEKLAGEETDTTSGMGNGLANFLKVAILVSVLAILAYLFSLLYQWKARIQFRHDITAMPKPRPQVLFGMAVTRKSLPANIPQAFEEHIAMGQTRAALSLLYRATLSRLIHDYHFDFHDSNTELECAQSVQASAHAQLKLFMTTLTDTWLLAAYGHHLPDTKAAMQLLAQWNRTFSNGA